MNRDEKSVDISNAIRLLLEKDSIEIHFGKRIDEDNVEVVQKVLVSPETALQLSGKLLVACVEYQDKYRDLGIRVREDDK
jgi:hypothetical protein